MHIHRIAILSVFIIASALAASCAVAPAAPQIIVIVPPTSRATAAIAAPASSDTPLAPAGPTVTPYPTTDFQNNNGLPVTVPTTAPLQINFGTQTPAPTLNWRPPPMPVPVSIRPEDHFWFARPIASNAVNWPHPLYRYGSTYFGFMRAHTGVDLDSDFGTPVLAAGPGVVVWVGYGLYGSNPPENDPYGNAVVIKHDFGYDNQPMFTVYAHMQKTLVWLNQPVKTGDPIGEVGSTGASSGPHLHFEVRIGENKFINTYNPELWLAPPTGWGVLAGRVLDPSGHFIPELHLEVRDSAGRVYPIWTYAASAVNPDPIYKENFVISDLPAGTYTYSMIINSEPYVGTTDILPGQTTFVIVQEGLQNIPRTAEPAATNGRAPTLTFTPSLTFTSSNTPMPTRTPRPTRTP
ncbi:MAG: M23 family metallopeptidase [Chloroflexi bacterium]|nr:M23 family metallopeptidase [Chloroflexota bacterium]